jgi:hypothetical protein
MQTDSEILKSLDAFLTEHSTNSIQYFELPSGCVLWLNADKGTFGVHSSKSIVEYNLKRRNS